MDSEFHHDTDHETSVGERRRFLDYIPPMVVPKLLSQAVTTAATVVASRPSLLVSRISPLGEATSVATATIASLEQPASAVSFAASIRGGAAAKAVLDLSRESQNIAMLASYGVVTALVMNSVLRLFSGTKFKKENGAPRLIFSISAGICVLCSAFSAVMFQMLAIYCKTALGMANDAGYIAFWEATAMYRQWGFRSFLTSFATFVTCFILSFFSKYIENNGDEQEHEYGKLLLGGSIGMALFGSFHIKRILDLATAHIF